MRIPIRHQPPDDTYILAQLVSGGGRDKGKWNWIQSENSNVINSTDHFFSLPYRVGDRLWVREAIYCDDGEGINNFDAASVPWEHVYYRADGECCEQIPECQCASVGKPKWTPSIHMPRWASRITLEIVSIRVERLQDISTSDAIAEGIEGDAAEWKNYRPEKDEDFKMFPWVQDPVYSYQTLWESINGPGSWDANPWVWVVEFKRIESPVLAAS